MVPIRVIAAMGRNRVIGAGAGMPWSIPSEYRHFLDSTRGHTLVMGRVSWEIFGADVATAHNLVVTRRASVDGAEAVAGLELAIERGRSLGVPIWVAGGASIYRQTLEQARALGVQELVLSVIDAEPEGDAHFPTFDTAAWPVVASEDHAEDGYRIHTHRRAT